MDSSQSSNNGNNNGGSGANNNNSGRGGRGRGCFPGHGGRGGRFNQGRGSNTNQGFPKKKNVKGDIEELGENVFDLIGGGTAGLFERTSRKLADYVGKEYGGSIRYAVEYHEEKKIADPDPLGSNPSAAQRMIYNEEIKEIVKEKRNMKKDLEKLCSVVWGQCTPAMKAKLRATKNYDNNKKDLKSIELLKEIKNISYNFQDKNYVLAAIHVVLERFINCKQKEDVSDQKYLDLFNDNVKTIKSYNIIMNVANLIIKQEHGDISNKSDAEKKELKEKAQERFLAYSYLKGMCKVRYSSIKEELHNEFLKGVNNYPATVQAAYELQVGYWKKNPKKNTTGSGVSFLTRKLYASGAIRNGISHQAVLKMKEIRLQIARQLQLQQQ